MSIAKTMILFGGGGHAAVVAETARAAGYVVLGYLSDEPDSDPAVAAAATGVGDRKTPEVTGLKRLGAIAELPTVLASHRHANFHAAVGDAALREKWICLLNALPLPPVVHPSAVVSPTATLGDGTFIGPQAVINARAVIRRGSIINTGSIIEHDCVIDEFSHCAPASVLAGGVQVGKGTLIGVGARVIPQVRIGSGCTLAAGAVAIADVPDGAMAMGVPARVVES